MKPIPDNWRELPALSIRQPWAWLILNGGKDVENRTWKTAFTGPCLIHAAKGFTRREFEEACAFARLAGFRGEIPDLGEIERGGIVGIAEIVECVGPFSKYWQRRSPWFVGPFAFCLRDVRPLPFTPCAGALGFFRPKLEQLAAPSATPGDDAIMTGGGE